jgi:hypothetical protein
MICCVLLLSQKTGAQVKDSSKASDYFITFEEQLTTRLYISKKKPLLRCRVRKEFKRSGIVQIASRQWVLMPVIKPYQLVLAMHFHF